MDGEPEAYRDDSLRGASISPRERLERIEAMLARMDDKLDSKLDGMNARIGALERFGSANAQKAEKDTALLDSRVEVLEKAYAVYLGTAPQQAKQEQEFHERMEKDLAEAKTLMATEIENIKKGQLDVGRIVKYVGAIVITAGIVADALVRFFAH